MNEQLTTASAFDDFWSYYPRKVGKGAARKAYTKALKLTTHDDIMFGLSEQMPSMQSKETQFIPHASTWLNSERWNDEPEEPTSPAGQKQGGNSRFDEARDRALRSAARGPKRGSCGF